MGQVTQFINHARVLFLRQNLTVKPGLVSQLMIFLPQLPEGVGHGHVPTHPAFYSSFSVDIIVNKLLHLASTQTEDDV